MPFKPGERLYRSFSATNFQPVERDDSADTQEQSYRVRGYYTVWGAEYELYPRTKYWPAEYEQVDRHALDDADVSDVIFQENHEGSPLARIRNGSLELGTDDHGAWCIADLGGCQRGREIFESIKNGLIVEMSFGFIIDNNEDSDGYTTFKDEDGDYHTTITRIKKVFDCSCVSIPASPYTEISELRSRSAAAARIEADRKASEQEPETRSADTEEVTDNAPIEGEFEPDVESIAKRVAEILDIQYRKDDPRDDNPDDDHDDDNDSDDDDDDVKERALVDETLKRRQRRARAMRLATI